MYIHSMTSPQRPSSQIPSSSSLARILGSRHKPTSRELDREQLVTERGSELLRRQRELRAHASRDLPVFSPAPLSGPSPATPRGRPLSASRGGRSGPAPAEPLALASPVDPFDLDARVEITEEIARRPPSRKNSAAYDLFGNSSERSKPAIPSSAAFKDRPQSRGLEPPAALHLDSPPTTPPAPLWASPAAPSQAGPGPLAEVLTLEDLEDSPSYRPLSRPSSSYLGGQRTQRPPLFVLDLPDPPAPLKRPTTSSGVFRPPSAGGFHAKAKRRGHSAFRTSRDHEFLGLFAN